VKLPKLLNWLQGSTASGIQGAVSDLVKLAILTLLGAILSYVLSRFPGLKGSFWINERFPVYQISICLIVTAGASIWITYSVMQREVSRLESLTEIDPGTGLLNLRALREQLPKAMERARQAANIPAAFMFCR
jgi:hypothetical protein